jgi:hypothetical protein
MRLSDREAVAFLRGVNSVRDGRLIALSIQEIDWLPAIDLVFDVPRGEQGNRYTLSLTGVEHFDYQFSSDNTPHEIAFVKCLWTEDERFYLSLDPWKESEAFVSEQDNDCFKARSVTLTVTRESAVEPAVES